MVQLILSAAILVLAVALKLTAPQVMSQIGDKLSTLMGQDTNFVEAFSSVGKAVSGSGKVGEALNDAYVAVFGPASNQKAGNTAAADSTSVEQTASHTDGTTGTDYLTVPVVYSQENLPANVRLTQQILGFAYTSPVFGVLTSPFGLREITTDNSEKFHYGVDLGVDLGTVIDCFADGTVTVVGESSELGRYLTVQHAGGIVTLYGHCSRILASAGQTVRLGDPIAEAGQTGNATGPHLHFEIHLNTTYLDPIYYVKLT